MDTINEALSSQSITFTCTATKLLEFPLQKEGIYDNKVGNSGVDRLVFNEHGDFCGKSYIP